MTEQSLHLKRWGELGRRLCSDGRTSEVSSWAPCRRLVRALEAYIRIRLQELRSLVEKSQERLKPLPEPLTLSFDLHRWLAPEREEAYSDWLAWILTEIRCTDMIAPLLYGKEVPDLLHEARSRSVTKADREVWVEEGHEGRHGRLDCALWFDRAVTVIEVKVIGAELADTAKQEGYLNWLQRQTLAVKPPILIAVGQPEDHSEYVGFKLLSWREFCLRGRRMLLKVADRRDLVIASLFAAFIGAVEINLLRLPSLKWLFRQSENELSNALHLGDRLDSVICYLKEVISEEVS